MPDAFDKILKEMKKFDAENESIANGGPYDPFGGLVGTSHAHCVKDFRESMLALAKTWKRKVTTLKAQGDRNPEYNAAKDLAVTYGRVHDRFHKCMLQPLAKMKTPTVKSSFGSR